MWLGACSHQQGPLFLPQVQTWQTEQALWLSWGSFTAQAGPVPREERGCTTHPCATSLQLAKGKVLLLWALQANHTSHTARIGWRSSGIPVRLGQNQGLCCENALGIPNLAVGHPHPAASHSGSDSTTGILLFSFPWQLCRCWEGFLYSHFPVNYGPAPTAHSTVA